VTNPFSLASLAPTWVKATAILKGDTPGHPFRGNQYASAHSLSDKATNLNNKVQQGTDDYATGAYQVTSFHAEVADEHRGIAEQHRASIGALKQEAQKAQDEGKPILASHIVSEMQAHADAARAHKEAADSHEKVVDLALNPRAGDWSRQEDEATHATKLADLASGQAAQAEFKTNSLPQTQGSRTVSMPNANGNPTLVANVERHSIFGKSAEITKGDTPGHAFHGNQWTTVGVGGRKNENTLVGPRHAHNIASDLAERVASVPHPSLRWREVGKQHAELADYHARRAGEMRAKADTAWKQHRNTDDEEVSSIKHEKAAQAHEAAWKAAMMGGTEGEMRQASQNAAEASRTALESDVAATSILGRNGAWGKGVVNRAKYGD